MSEPSEGQTVTLTIFFWRSSSNSESSKKSRGTTEESIINTVAQKDKAMQEQFRLQLRNRLKVLDAVKNVDVT